MIVLLILIALLLWFWLSPPAFVQGPDEGMGDTAVVADDGTWQFSYTPAAGNHTFAVRIAGASEPAATSSVTVAEAEGAAEDTATDSADEAASLPADLCSDAEPGIDQGDTYIVARCEWLTKIANRLGIPYGDLIAVNPQIEDTNLIYPGQIINLPPR